MTSPAALLDSNVVAALVEDHVHNAPSAALLAEFDPRNFAVAAHSYAEAYVMLTRNGPVLEMRFPPTRA